jgi:septin family protein
MGMFGATGSDVAHRFSLKPLDIEIMKRLGTRVNLIPVIAKADTLTQNDLFAFKQRVSYT